MDRQKCSGVEDDLTYHDFESVNVYTLRPTILFINNSYYVNQVLYGPDSQS